MVFPLMRRRIHSAYRKDRIVSANVSEEASDVPAEQGLGPGAIAQKIVIVRPREREGKKLVAVRWENSRLPVGPGLRWAVGEGKLLKR
jgi:hypothetical protein